MRMDVAYEGGSAALEIDDQRVIGVWQGPAGRPEAPLRPRVRGALEQPRDFPPLRRAVVPGDHVVLPVSPGIPELSEILEVVCEILQDAGVLRPDITVLWPGPSPPPPAATLPDGVVLAVHDPDDRASLAYLASTSTDRRVYLNRLLTDADFVLPIGRLGFDPTLGYAGPWSAIYPAMSDTATRRELAATAPSARPDPSHVRPALAEATEVGWLLGSQLQVGVAVVRDGAGAIEAGRDDSVRREGARLVDRDWTVSAPTTADLVVAGLGRAGDRAGWTELAAGLATAARLVRPGGKIVLLSQVSGAPGPALQHLSSLSEPELGPSGLAGHRDDPDYPIARQIAETLVRADVYLLSRLDPDLVEGLGLVPLSRPEDVRRLAALADSVFVVESAEAVQVDIADEG